MDTNKYFIVYVHFGTSWLFYRMTDLKLTYWHILSFLPHVIIVIMNVIFALFYCMICQKWRNKDVQSINQSYNSMPIVTELDPHSCYDFDVWNCTWQTKSFEYVC